MKIKVALVRFIGGAPGLEAAVSKVLDEAGANAEAVVSVCLVGEWAVKHNAYALLTYKGSGGKKKGKS